MHIGHWSPSTWETSRHIGHRSQRPSTGITSAKPHRPLVTKHTGNFLKGPRHIGHRSPHTRETLDEAHRPSGTEHTRNFGQDTSAIGQHTGNFVQDTSAIGHHTHGKLPEGAKAHRPSVTKHTGNFGQCTSAIGQHMGILGHDESAIGHQAHGKHRPRHIGHRSARETSAKTHRPSVTTHTGNFLKGPLQAAKAHRPSVTKHKGNFLKGPQRRHIATGTALLGGWGSESQFSSGQPRADCADGAAHRCVLRLWQGGRQTVRM